MYLSWHTAIRLEHSGLNWSKPNVFWRAHQVLKLVQSLESLALGWIVLHRLLVTDFRFLERFVFWVGDGFFFLCLEQKNGLEENKQIKKIQQKE